MTHNQWFYFVNIVALMGWANLLIYPWKPRWVKYVSGRVVPLLLAAVYFAFMVMFWGKGDGGFGSLEALMALFAVPELLLIGWIHYLVFDLFVGAWECQVATAEGLPFWLVCPCLILTMVAGPVGLLAFFGARRVFSHLKTIPASKAS